MEEDAGRCHLVSGLSNMAPSELKTNRSPGSLPGLVQVKWAGSQVEASDRAHATRTNNLFIIFCLNKNNIYII